MFKFFLPRKTKKVLSESEIIFESLKRNRVTTQDILPARDLETVQGLEARYPALLKARDVEALENLNKEAMKAGRKAFPPSAWAGGRETADVSVGPAFIGLA